MASVEGDMTRQGFTATQALEQMVASEDEGPEEDVSEEEDGEEYDSEHDDDAVDDFKRPRTCWERRGRRRSPGGQEGRRRDLPVEERQDRVVPGALSRAGQGSPPGGRHEGLGKAWARRS
ncbi:hypothetical protein DPEC_G00379410 [Dallia pectoralis]|nr:hypothetical protein DPEC_G00379410 [Dallia pectoralis]